MSEIPESARRRVEVDITEDEFWDDYARQPRPDMVWISICSAHRTYKETCSNCQAGNWMFTLDHANAEISRLKIALAEIQGVTSVPTLGQSIHDRLTFERIHKIASDALKKQH